jgi:uncharacterized OB-fold protein
MAVVSGAGADPTASVEVGVDEDTAFYWEAASQGLLMAQRCATCARLWHPPSPVCPHCQGLDWTVEALPGTGTLHSVAKVHDPGSPIQGSGYLICLVELPDPTGGPGVRVVANLRGTELEGAAIGMPVELTFEALQGEQRLPQFRVAADA